MKKYMLVRKSKKGNWKPCALRHVVGNEVGNTSFDKEAVDQERDQMAQLFKANTYAVLEITED